MDAHLERLATHHRNGLLSQSCASGVQHVAYGAWARGASEHNLTGALAQGLLAQRTAAAELHDNPQV